MNEWVVEIHWHTEVHKQSYHSVKNIYSTCSGLLITIIIYLGDMEITLKSKVDNSITDCWHLYWWTCTQISSTNSYQLKVMNSLWSEWWNILGISIMATLNRWHWLRTSKRLFHQDLQMRWFHSQCESSFFKSVFISDSLCWFPKFDCFLYFLVFTTFFVSFTYILCHWN